MNGGELVGPWAELVVHGLIVGGVRHLVVSPGSRSTPFALAALRRPELTCWSVVDERSAGFFALGQAKLTGVPTALLATSGTAPAHYLPAVIEAGAAGCPLVVVSADRPHELIHCGAPQTIDQTHLFGTQVRHAVDLGNPDPRPAALRGALRRVVQAVVAARGPRPGPVHINARAAKPLEPAAPASAEGQALVTEVATLIARGGPAVAAPPRLTPAPEVLAHVAQRLAEVERGLIVCGALTPAQAPALGLVHALAERTGFVLVAETTSQLRTTGAVGSPVVEARRMEALLLDANFRARCAPELVLQLGAAPLGAGWSDWTGPAVERHVLAAHGWADPSHAAATLIEGDLRLALDALVVHVPDPPPATAAARGEYARRLTAFEGVAAAAVEAVLAAPETGLTEGQVVRAVLANLPAGGPLVLGSSLALRAVDLFAPGLGEAHAVVAHRGVNGIDGLVSTAAGVASVRGPATLLLGDVSFLHDVGGLWAARHAVGGLTLVVLDDRGGRIFDELPVAAVATGEELAYFTTPHDFDLTLAAELFGHRQRRVETLPELVEALNAAAAAAGVTLIVAALAPGEPHRELARLAAEISRRVAAELAP